MRWGLTGVHDAGTELEDIAILKRLLKNGELPIRVYAMAYGDAAIEHYLKNGPEIGHGDGRLTVRSFKIYVDGALGSRGAELSAPYSDAPQTSGLRQMQDADLDRFIRRAQEKGFQVNAHAIGDLGVKRMLDAIERNHVSAADRYRVEHASMISPRNLQRFHTLGVIASMQPVFIGEYSRWGEERVGPERAAWLMPVADLVMTGAVLASGTDYPASDSGDPRTNRKPEYRKEASTAPVVSARSAIGMSHAARSGPTLLHAPAAVLADKHQLHGCDDAERMEPLQAGARSSTHARHGSGPLR